MRSRGSTGTTLRAPKGVVCLPSALDVHELTTEVPREVYLALPRGQKAPKLGHPPLRVFHFSGEAYSEGIETHPVDGRDLKVYSEAKTIADCFKFRNQLGTSVAVEALRRYLARPEAGGVRALLPHARTCRVERVITPYLEALQS